MKLPNCDFIPLIATDEQPSVNSVINGANNSLSSILSRDSPSGERTKSKTIESGGNENGGLKSKEKKEFLNTNVCRVNPDLESSTLAQEGDLDQRKNKNSLRKNKPVIVRSREERDLAMKVSRKDAEELQKLNDKMEAKLTSIREKLSESKSVHKDCHLNSDQHILSGSYDSSDNLRPIVIDGCNVAMSHGNKEAFSCLGLRICVDWFKARGHKEITVFVPMWRKEAVSVENLIKDRDILFQLESEKVLVFTPSRNVNGRRLTCHDDLYILNLALKNDGIVVSNDNYRDLIIRNPEYKKLVEERLLMYSFVNNRFMPPDDPLGRHGPSLDVFLRKKNNPPPNCPYGKKCTYGYKCKFYHPERNGIAPKSLTELLLDFSISEMKSRNTVNSTMMIPSSYHNGSEKAKIFNTLSLPPNAILCDVHSKPPQSPKKPPLQKGKLSLKSHLSFPLDPCKEMFSKSCDGQPIERKSGNISISASSSFASASSLSVKDSTGECNRNLHRKLQRQLTLNPGFDARLLRMSGYEDNKSSSNSNKSRLTDRRNTSPQEVFCNGHKQVTRIRSDGGCPLRLSNGKATIKSSGNLEEITGFDHFGSNSTEIERRRRMPNSSYKPTYPQGQANQRISTCLGVEQRSQETRKSSSAYQGKVTHDRPRITRMASAPNSNCISSMWQTQSEQSVIANAISDSHLNENQVLSHSNSRSNLNAQTQTSHPFLTLAPHLIMPHPKNSFTATNQRYSTQPKLPIQSESISPSRNTESAKNREESKNKSRNSFGHGNLLTKSGNRSCPVLANLSNDDSDSLKIFSSDNYLSRSSSSSELFANNLRSKLFFHLTQIFPRKQVKTAMDMLPFETDAKSLCKTLLMLLP